MPRIGEENIVPRMENNVLASDLASRHVDRSLAGRREAYAAEVRALVEGSFRLIQQTGRLEPTVGEIVRAAGLSNKSFYRHFRSKDELLLAVLDDGIRQLAGYLEHRMQAADSPLARVREWIGGVLEQALNARSAAATRPFALSRGRLSELFPGEVAESEALLSGMLARAIADAVDAGELSHAEPERDAALVYGLAMGWLERSLASDAKPAREQADHLAEFAMRGLHR